jgi:Ca2+-binding RTX toxin-like protein
LSRTILARPQLFVVSHPLFTAVKEHVSFQVRFCDYYVPQERGDHMSASREEHFSKCLRIFAGFISVAVLWFGAPTVVARAQETPTCGYPATIIGTEGDDVLVGTDEQDFIVGLGGDDLIRGLSNDDRLCGGDGFDTIYGGEGYDWFEADAGDDTVRDRDHIGGTLGAGDDSVKRAWFAIGGRGNDSIIGFRHGTPAEFQGGPGDDVLVGTDACVECAGDGDHLDGGRGDDVIRGRSRLNYITPGPGRDTIYMGRRRLSWSGILSYREAEQGLRVDLRRGIVTGQGRDQLFGIVTLVYGSDFDDVLLGRQERQFFKGYRGGDVIKGRAGDDGLVGGPGFDTVSGGKGKDTCGGEIKRRCEYTY